jgi:hypothetical protein
MGIISKLFGKLFGNNHQKAELTELSTNDYLSRWEKDRQERIQSAEQRLKEWIVASVKEKGGLQFTWESGNDEAFVTFKDSTDSEEENYQDLEEYIIDKLDIPDAGEFEMTGSGTVYIDNNLVKAKYSSSLKEIIDYDEETEQVTYSEEEQDSGDKVLFAI